MLLKTARVCWSSSLIKVFRFGFFVDKIKKAWHVGRHDRVFKPCRGVHDVVESAFADAVDRIDVSAPYLPVAKSGLGIFVIYPVYTIDALPVGHTALFIHCLSLVLSVIVPRPVGPDVECHPATHGHSAATLAPGASPEGRKCGIIAGFYAHRAFAPLADGYFGRFGQIPFHSFSLLVDIGHAERDVTPCALVVFVLGTDELFGDSGLVGLLDDFHSFEELFVAAVLGHLAELEHTACLDVALAVTTQ